MRDLVFGVQSLNIPLMMRGQCSHPLKIVNASVTYVKDKMDDLSSSGAIVRNVSVD